MKNNLSYERVTGTNVFLMKLILVRESFILDLMVFVSGLLVIITSNLRMKQLKLIS